MDAGQHTKCRADVVVLFRPHHPRICAGYLERAGERGCSAGVAGPGRAARSDPLTDLPCCRGSPTSDIIEFGGIVVMMRSIYQRHCEERSDEAIQTWGVAFWNAALRLSSGAHSRRPVGSQ